MAAIARRRPGRLLKSPTGALRGIRLVARNVYSGTAMRISTRRDSKIGGFEIKEGAGIIIESEVAVMTVRRIVPTRR